MLHSQLWSEFVLKKGKNTHVFMQIALILVYCAIMKSIIRTCIHSFDEFVLIFTGVVAELIYCFGFWYTWNMWVFLTLYLALGSLASCRSVGLFRCGKNLTKAIFPETVYDVSNCAWWYYLLNFTSLYQVSLTFSRSHQL